MHSVFLYHAIAAGMDMGIVNAGELPVYDQIEPELREAVEDVILNRKRRRHRTPGRPRAEVQGRQVGRPGGRPQMARRSPWASGWSTALVHGITEFIDADTEEARLTFPIARCTSSKAR